MKPKTNKPTRSFKNRVLCFCEGETEKVYLNCLKKDKYKNVHIELKPQIRNASFKYIFYEIEQLLAEPPETNINLFSMYWIWIRFITKTKLCEFMQHKNTLISGSTMH